jgi:hypothetical protein
VRRWCGRCCCTRPRPSSAILAASPHGTLRRTTLDTVAEHIRSAEKLLRALDDVLDPKQGDAGHHLSVQHLQRRVEREQHVLRQVS